MSHSEDLSIGLRFACERAKDGGYCDIAKELKEERTADKSSKRKIFENVLSNLLWLAIAVIIGYFTGKTI